MIVSVFYTSFFSHFTKKKKNARLIFVNLTFLKLCFILLFYTLVKHYFCQRSSGARWAAHEKDDVTFLCHAVLFPLFSRSFRFLPG